MGRSEVLSRQPIPESDEEYSCLVSCSHGDCFAIERITLHRDAIAEIEAGRAKHLCKKSPDLLRTLALPELPSALRALVLYVLLLVAGVVVGTLLIVSR